MWGGSGRWGWWLTSLTSRRTSPPQRAIGKGARKGTRPPPPKGPRTATPAERVVRAEQAEPVGGRGQRGVVQEWVDQQRAGAWEACAISAEAANRDLGARLSRVHEDRRDCESRLEDVTKERDRLATKVRTLERDVATLRKAKPAAQQAEAVERAEGAEAPAPHGDRGGVQCCRCPVPPGRRTGLACPGRGMRRPDVRSVHRPADGHDGQWPAGRCGQRGPRRPQGDCRNGGSAPAEPPPHRLTSAAMDPSFVEAVAEQSSQGTASRSSAPGGGGVRRYPPEHPSFLTTTNVILAPPPKHGQFDRYVGYSPPTVRNFLQHSLYINWGTVCPRPVCDFFCGTVCILFGVCYAP